ncbi:MAG: Tex-like N-terminal domain-containing protein, partial [Solirubrobacterales bacterium]
MNQNHVVQIASELTLNPRQVLATAELLEGGATVPFIARYRKEVTGSLDEVAIMAIRTRLTQLAELDARREAILASLQERGLLTDELKDKIMQAQTQTELEDIYLPYRPKRRTRATIAKEKGLEPLAQLILAQDPATDPLAQATG